MTLPRTSVDTIRAGGTLLPSLAVILATMLR